MDRTDYVILEENVPLSQSKIWDWQKKYYLESGIDAWKRDVPHYVTSNPFIANAYAEIALEFIQEWIKKNPDSVHKPFYLLELGAGHSIFSYYFLKCFTALRESLPANFQFCYVITDLSQKNLDFAISHPQFKFYIDQGVLDFALFNLERKDPIKLQYREEYLNSATINNPVITIANYIFDSIKKDAFYVDDRFRLKSSLISIKSKASNLKDGNPISLKELIIDFFHAPVDSKQYTNEHFKHILSEYSQKIPGRSFLFPVDAFSFIDYLNELSANRLLLISSDKGYVSSELFSTESKPHIEFHGNCFSLMTNFDALGCYFKIKGGDAFAQMGSTALVSCAYLSEGSFVDFPKLKLLLERNLNRISPQDYFNLYRLIAFNAYSIDLENLATALKFSGYDPELFHHVHAKINADITFKGSMLPCFSHIVHSVADQFYFMPGCANTYFEAGLFFHTVKEYKIALDYYQKSELFFKDSFTSYYNAGLCCFHLQFYERAELYFLSALELNPKSKDAKDWLKTARKKIKLSTIG